jgi:hypothetical protein
MKNITAKMGKIKSSPAMNALKKGIRLLDTKNSIAQKTIKPKRSVGPKLASINPKTKRAISAKVNLSTPQSIAKDIKKNPLQQMAGQEAATFNNNPLK